MRPCCATTIITRRRTAAERFWRQKTQRCRRVGHQAAAASRQNCVDRSGPRWRKTLQVYAVEDRYTVGHARHLEALPNNNMQSTLIADHNRGFEQNRVTQRPCFQCQRLCPWDVEIGEGEFKGKIGHFNAGAEWLDTFWNLGVKGNATLYLAERINDLGIECGHFAFGAGVLFEAYDKGLVKAEDCDGLRLDGATSKPSTNCSK